MTGNDTDQSQQPANAGEATIVAPPQHRIPTRAIVAATIVLAIVCALVWAFVVPKPFDVTVNGQTVTVAPRSTVATLVEKGSAQPTPGNLIAVDSTLIEEGAGQPFSATVNGQPADGSTLLASDMVVEIGNGADVMESFTEHEEAVPFEIREGDLSASSYYQGSIHQMQDGQDGLAIARTGDVSGITVREVITQPVNGGYHVYTAQPADPVIALTFDDGPWPDTTDAILDILEQYGAKATFFTIGRQISTYADSVRRASTMGCQICTHTWDHASGSGRGVDITRMSADEQIWEVTSGYDAIAEVTGAQPERILRAPGGNFHDSAITTLWPYVDAEIGWDVDTKDWSRPGVDAIVNALLSVQPGQVVLMHDGGGDRWQTVEALRQAMPVLVERGYRFVTISELMAYGEPAA